MGYDIGEQIRIYRERNGLSQKELAALIGISPNRLSNWERGVNKPDINFLIKICQALNVSPSEFLSFGLSSDEYNAHERSLISAYRNKDDFKTVVDILLRLINR